MWSRPAQGDVLQWKGGTSPQTGPLAATSPMAGAIADEVTCRRGGRETGQ